MDPLGEPYIERRGEGPPVETTQMLFEVEAAAKRNAVVVVVIVEPSNEGGSDLRVLSNATENEVTRRALHWARRSISLEAT